MSPTEATTPSGDAAQADQDLGPLAWVLDELRKSLDSAAKATRRFVREAQEVRESDLAALDSSPLRMAKQHLHQASGALEMVGMPKVALLLRAMESAVQHYVQHPGDCTEAVALTLEKSSCALLEFLEAVLAGKHVAAVALFPQYRDVHALFGNQSKVHPADLWPIERRLRDPQLPRQVPALDYLPEQRKILDTAVLQIVKGQDIALASARVCDVCLGFAQAQTETSMRVFWKVAAAYFDAMAHGLLNADIYGKRMASRVLMVCAALAKGDPVAPERLLQDMLFFCAQAGKDPQAAQAATIWHSVYSSFGLQRHAAVDYEQASFGRFDPALLEQARKRMGAATEIWSALAGGDINKLKPAVDQFTLVCNSLVKLHPESHGLANALTQVTHSVAVTGQPPSAEIAMEVATAVLYLQAAFASLDMADAVMASHSETLAQRLTAVLAGQASQPLAPWMEQLYRQVSDQQTMGSVLGELRGTLGETEKLLDQYFRNPAEKAVLAPVASLLAQMRGVLSVLGLEPASQAMVRMRQNVERLQSNDVPEAEQHVLFEKMGNSLGALGFVIDMLSYQRNVARKLYEFDEEEGELKLLMGRVRVRSGDEGAKTDAQVLQARVPQTVQPAVTQEVLPAEGAQAAVQDAQPSLLDSNQMESLGAHDAPASSVVKAQPALCVLPEDTDSELLDIFLDEAREVVANGRAALQVLAHEPANLSEQTVLRRAFHTLKGSSRMVGLDEFGQAGWAMEQMLNAWLAEQKSMPQPMQQLSLQALNGFDVWASAIEANAAEQWQSAPFRASADAMRLEARFIPLDMAAVQGAVSADVAEPIAAIQKGQRLAADALSLEGSTAEDVQKLVLDDAVAVVAVELEAEPVPAAPALPSDDLGDFADALLTAPDLAAMDVQEISLDEFDALLQAADDVMAAAIRPSADEVANLPLQTSAHHEEIIELTDIASVELAAKFSSATHDVAAIATPSEAEAFLPETAAQTLATKRIGDLSISLPLFNVYLGEAEMWSSHLLDALTAWQENLDQAQPEMAIVWTHSLAGSSATVGFAELSALARHLEHALQHVQFQAHGVAAQVQCFVQAAQEVRGLLHQFAAGFLRTASPELLAQLQQIASAELATPASASHSAWVPELPAAYADAVQGMSAVVPQGDDMDAHDVVDPELFPIFEEEAAELLPVLGGAMREWAAHPAKPEARSTLLRALHTLKGSARLAGAMRMGEMAHRLESAVEALQVETVTTEQIELLFTRLDALEADLARLRALNAEAQAAPLLAVTDADALESSALPVVCEPLLIEPSDGLPPAEVAPSLAPTPLPPVPAWVNPSAAVARQGVQPTVRVRSQLLDRLINEAGEVMIARSRLDERVGSIKTSLGDLTHNLDRLRQQLRDIEVQAESQMQSRMQLSKDAGAEFDPLEFDRFTRVQELTRMMAESVNDVATVQRTLLRDVAGAEDDLIAQGRQARELQRDLLRTRMVEFDSISERLYAVVRLTAKETGKQVKLGLTGGTIEMDRGVLERMLPAFEHLLRNCVDHGIEMPAQREAAGKDSTGAISVQVQQEGNDVAVTIQDDGAGLPIARIRDKALALGLIAADDTVDAARAAQLVFMPGFSTAEQLTGVSGRGIGMDVVRSEVQALGGRIETSSAEGQGTSFRLVLPLTTAVTQVVMLRAGQFTVGVPASLVEMVQRVSLGDLEAAYRSGELVDGDARIPFYWAGAVWSQSPRSLEAGACKTRPVVIFRSASQRIALHVDEVLGHQEVVVKNLGPQMSRLPGLTGMSLLASGAVVLIYNPVALTAVYGERIRHVGEGLPALLDGHAGQQLPQPAAGLVSSSQVPLVMVVDDSITVRRVSQRLLQREGYRVVTAADGLQALEKLQDEVPCVVLSDIEMPRMDGFDLLRNIRAQARLQQLPIIMITSRIAQKHRDHAMELGASHYLGKPYSDDELMALVHHYAAGRALPVLNSAAVPTPASTGSALVDEEL